MSLTKRSICFFLAASSLSMVGMTGTKNAAVAGSLSSLQKIQDSLGVPDEAEDRSPIDYGTQKAVGNRVASGVVAKSSAATRGASAAIPSGDTSAASGGMFGSSVNWPLIPIHVVLLPDGRVMSYGTAASGAQGAELVYDVWDPTLGTDSNSHLLLSNTTGTDIFCGAQSVLLSGDVLTGGGDLTIDGERNSANNTSNIFAPKTNSIAANTAMRYARWYASLVSLPDGDMAIFGGRQNVGSLTPPVPVPTPELYERAGRYWAPLTGADSSDAFGVDSNWFYPRAYVAPGGQIFVIGRDGKTFYVSTDVKGGSVNESKLKIAAGNVALPTIPYAPGLALSVRANQSVVVVDYRTSTPVATPTDNIDHIRYWASGSILADGKVVVTGGSQVPNKLTGVAYSAQIWDPKTGHWTAGADAAKPRLYHSNSLLLPDATVLTAGGGAPGPVRNLNAEIYYPPYLYAPDGTAAPRPVINATDAVAYSPGGTLNATVRAADTIARLTFVRTGSATHSNNSDQRFIDLAFSQNGRTVTAVLPSDTSVLVPGFYMLFAFDAAGVPSVARIVKVTSDT